MLCGIFSKNRLDKFQQPTVKSSAGKIMIVGIWTERGLLLYDRIDPLFWDSMTVSVRILSVDIVLEKVPSSVPYVDLTPARKESSSLSCL